eukprot:GAHX01002459.1.p1 GENE.GAHX01002459.1~~GAHX01002459.1.p1  ORF type:complete len:700 (+),score=193.11 GAHX01002459.1:30-2102(+)
MNDKENLQTLPPALVTVVGPPGTGKSQLIRTILKEKGSGKLGDISHYPFTLRISKEKRISFLELKFSLELFSFYFRVSDSIILVLDITNMITYHMFEVLALMNAIGPSCITIVLTNTEKLKSDTLVSSRKNDLKKQLKSLVPSINYKIITVKLHGDLYSFIPIKNVLNNLNKSIKQYKALYFNDFQSIKEKVVSKNKTDFFHTHNFIVPDTIELQKTESTKQKLCVSGFLRGGKRNLENQYILNGLYKLKTESFEFTSDPIPTEEFRNNSFNIHCPNNISSDVVKNNKKVFYVDKVNFKEEEKGIESFKLIKRAENISIPTPNKKVKIDKTENNKENGELYIRAVFSFSKKDALSTLDLSEEIKRSTLFFGSLNDSELQKKYVQMRMKTHQYFDFVVPNQSSLLISTGFSFALSKPIFYNDRLELTSNTSRKYFFNLSAHSDYITPNTTAVCLLPSVLNTVNYTYKVLNNINESKSEEVGDGYFDTRIIAVGKVKENLDFPPAIQKKQKIECKVSRCFKHTAFIDNFLKNYLRLSSKDTDALLKGNSAVFTNTGTKGEIKKCYEREIRCTFENVVLEEEKVYYILTEEVKSYNKSRSLYNLKKKDFEKKITFTFLKDEKVMKNQNSLENKIENKEESNKKIKEKLMEKRNEIKKVKLSKSEIKQIPVEFMKVEKMKKEKVNEITKENLYK